MIQRLITTWWHDEDGISSVEYALLCALFAAGLIAAAEMLSSAVADQLGGAAGWIEDEGCGNRGGGDGTGAGTGQGGGNTC